MTLSEIDRAYIAAVVDSLAKLTTRVVHRDELPVVTIQGKHPVLPWLAEVTGVRLMRLDKNYARHQCTEHCPGRHMAIESWTHRWQLTGARATVLLRNIEPYMRLQVREARRLIDVGAAAGHKSATAVSMARLGWGLADAV